MEDLDLTCPLALQSENCNKDNVFVQVVDGWRLVRFLPPTSPGWYSGNDNLAGTAPRGTAYDYNSEWSIPFGEFDEFCFSTRNFLHWLHCTRDAAIGATYGHAMRDITQSSRSNTSYTALWNNRGSAIVEDSWIELRSHDVQPVNTDTGDRILYGEDSYSDGHWSLPAIASDGGMCVWVRSSANRPVEDPTGGPSSMGDITFNQELVQHLDSGPRTMNITTNGGFTAVAVVKFTGAPAEGEQIFDFGSGANDNNIIIYRDGITTQLNFEVWNGNSDSACVVSMPSAIVQNRWLTIVALYESNSKKIELQVGSDVVVTTCATTQTDRVVSNTYVGKENWGGDPMHTITGMMYGSFIGSDYTGLTAWRLQRGIYVSFIQQGHHLKMTSISESDVLAASSSTPASPDD